MTEKICMGSSCGKPIENDKDAIQIKEGEFEARKSGMNTFSSDKVVGYMHRRCWNLMTGNVTMDDLRMTEEKVKV